MARNRTRPTRYPGVLRRDDGRIVVRVKVVSDKTGKPLERTRTLPENATVADGRRVAEQLRNEATEENRTRPPSLRVFAARWIARKLRRGDWNQSGATRAQVELLFRRHVGELGDYYVDRITPADLQDWMDWMLDRGVNVTSVRTYWGWLKRCIRAACADYMMADPTSAIEGPKGGSRSGGRDLTLMPSQVQVLVDRAREDPVERWYYLVVLGFATGARPGELVAARVDDLDLSGEIGVWTVRRHAAKPGVLEGTKAGPERTVYLDPTATAILRPRWHDRARVGSDVYLFPGYRRGKREPSEDRPVSKVALHAWLERACKDVGIEPPVSAKTFRQTYVTLAAMSSVAPVFAKEQVGHASEQIHRIYQRVPDASRAEAARQMGQVIPLDPRRSKVGTDVGAAGGGRDEG